MRILVVYHALLSFAQLRVLCEEAPQVLGILWGIEERHKTFKHFQLCAKNKFLKITSLYQLKGLKGSSYKAQSAVFHLWGGGYFLIGREWGNLQ